MDADFELHPETDADWTDDGICKGLTHVFFGPAAERPERRAEREAIAVAYCNACPVAIECRTSARLNREHGFWGGENDEQRAAAGFAPRSPSRRAVIAARDSARSVPLTRAAATADLQGRPDKTADLQGRPDKTADLPDSIHGAQCAESADSNDSSAKPDDDVEHHATAIGA